MTEGSAPVAAGQPMATDALPAGIDLGAPGGLDYRLKRCRHGWMLYNVNDMYIGRSLDTYGEYSEHEIDLMGQVLRPGSVVVEVGANIGSLTVPLAQRVGPNGFVFAFEPERILFQNLAANIALNGLLNVATIRAAVGAAAGRAAMPPIDHRRHDNHGAWRLGPAGSGENVDVRAIDSLELAQCRLIKIDVEGMELDVLRGADATIRRLRPALYVENNPGPQSAALIAHLMALDYRLWWHVPPLFRSDNFFACADNVFPGIASANMFCLPRSVAGQIRGMSEVKGPDDPPPIGPPRAPEPPAA